MFKVPLLLRGSTAKGREATPVNKNHKHGWLKVPHPSIKPPHLLKDTCIVVYLSLQTRFPCLRGLLPDISSDQRVKCEKIIKQVGRRNTQRHKAITYFRKESFEEFPVLEVDVAKREGLEETGEGGTRA